MKKNPFKVVIASDQQLVAEGLQSLINSSESFRALKIFSEDAPLLNYLQGHPVDLLLLDMNFTGEDGFQLCRKIKKRFPEIKVAVVTAFEGDKTLQMARKFFADGFFIKSICLHDLLSGLKKVMKAPPGSFITCERLRKAMSHPEIPVSGKLEFHDKLSKRELEIMQLVVNGKKNSEIAKQLSISYDTVKTHRNHILNKLGLRNVAELVKYAILTSFGNF